MPKSTCSGFSWAAKMSTVPLGCALPLGGTGAPVAAVSAARRLPCASRGLWLRAQLALRPLRGGACLRQSPVVGAQTRGARPIA